MRGCTAANRGRGTVCRIVPTGCGYVSMEIFSDIVATASTYSHTVSL